MRQRLALPTAVVFLVVFMVNWHVDLLLHFHVLYHRNVHVLVNRYRDVLDHRHFLDNLDFFHDGHVDWNVDLLDVVVVDGVHLVWDVDGHVFVAAEEMGGLVFVGFSFKSP